jgi:hypothetical protein
MAFESPGSWTAYQDNAADPAHTLFVHGKRFRTLGMPEGSGFFRPLVWFTFAEHQFGLVKGWCYEGSSPGWGNLLVVPNILAIPGEIHWRVPIDEASTYIVIATRQQRDFTDIGPQYQAQTPRVVRAPELLRLDGEPDYWSFQGQDAAAAGSQEDPVPNRNVPSDTGVVLWRQMLSAMRTAPPSAALAYAQLRTSDGLLDPERWMGGDRPASSPSPMRVEGTVPWSEAFPRQGPLFVVPRGPAGPGPLRA